MVSQAHCCRGKCTIFYKVPLTIHPQCPRQEGQVKELGNGSVGWRTAETCPQNCEVLVSILNKANGALVRVGGIVKCCEANPPKGVNIKQMWDTAG